MNITLNGEQRFILSRSILPTTELGNLRESLTVKKLRELLNFTDSEKEEIEYEENNMGQVSLDPSALSELPERDFEITDEEARVIALGFLHDEADENVRADEAYASVLEMFIEKVEEVRDED